ncbi:hypothetical protein H257_08656 [Aphanomyces astaci]|uniref:Uncharacterized protein n=1 Tax=Aphanomyces astaci TaxID=112090 RepID=W4GFI9_APHAT|nr:hypothetical protein H257_08656 [Aphanomyces astaci]ETV77829.1 hypothetical protein H257_08656 [Aphanomyces astaci]|eukprot:XP_009832939.1 hypothetical protein H257_08656 [Aphanomyces astaci]
MGVAVAVRRVGAARTGVLDNVAMGSCSLDGSILIIDVGVTNVSEEGTVFSAHAVDDANENDLTWFHDRDTTRRFCGELCTVLKYFGGSFAAIVATTLTADAVSSE